MANTRRLKITGGHDKDTQESINKMTREINKELSKIKVNRNTGINVNASPFLSQQGQALDKVGNLMVNVTIYDVAGNALKINNNGAASTTPESWTDGYVHGFVQSSQYSVAGFTCMHRLTISSVWEEVFLFSTVSSGWSKIDTYGQLSYLQAKHLWEGPGPYNGVYNNAGDSANAALYFIPMNNYGATNYTGYMNAADKLGWQKNTKTADHTYYLAYDCNYGCTVYGFVRRRA